MTVSNSWSAAWLNPPAALRPLDIRHGLVNRAGWRDDLDAVIRRGCGGVVMNVSWSDNYLQSPAAWQRLREVVAHCRAQGIRVWLYDENTFPSGGAGGRVLEGHPEFEAQCLADTADPTGRFKVMPAFEHTPAANMGYYVRRCANLMDDRAMCRFVDVTHEAYARELGDDLAWVEAFFTDEPSLLAYHSKTDPARFQNREIVIDPPDPAVPCLPCVPWVHDLPQRYADRYHEDLMACLPSLFGGDAAADREIRRRYWGLVADLVRERFFGRLGSWCAGHGLASSGHLLCEESLWMRIVLDGNALACLRKMQIPGIDILSSDPGFVFAEAGWLTALQATSAAIHNGTRRVMTEISDFVSTLGWIPRPPAGLRWMKAAAAWQAALGVTEFTTYYGFDAMPGPDVQSYCLYIGRLNAILRDAAPAPDVALFYPIEFLREDFVPTREVINDVMYPERFTAIDRQFNELGRTLLESRYAFALVDADVLESARIEEGRLAIGSARFDALVVPERPGLPDLPGIRAWLAEPGRQVHRVEDLAGRVGKALDFDGAGDRVLCSRFVRDGREIRVAVNTGETPVQGRVRLDPARTWTCWFPETGEVRPFGINEQGTGPLTLDGCECILLVGESQDTNKDTP